jgi:hypothetical protein
MYYILNEKTINTLFYINKQHNKSRHNIMPASFFNIGEKIKIIKTSIEYFL